MVPATSTPRPTPPVRLGVGIDTSRYGHVAVFLRPDLEPAAAPLRFAESGAGYAQLQARLEQLARKHPGATFAVRIDAAGLYANNLICFLQRLADSSGPHTGPRAGTTLTLSCGDPQRNKNYRAALFGAQKSDPIDALAAARFALAERPMSAPQLSDEQRTLRTVAARLQAVVRQRTRLINQLHQLLALTFPELALHVKDLSAGWVLEMVHRYPTAPLLARATPADLGAIAYLPDKHLKPLLAAARTSIGSLSGSRAEELVCDQVRQLRDVNARQLRPEKLLVDAYRALPCPNHIDTIKGLGDVTAAVLSAFILDINRFASVNKLVSYFGVKPVEGQSGVDRKGRPRPSRRWMMSRRGNDLVRRYLWMAALSAVRCNPAVRALYRRVVVKHPDHKGVAIGHAMRKLLHLVFAVWTTGKPFDPAHHPWERVTAQGAAPVPRAPKSARRAEAPAPGHQSEAAPTRTVVTGAGTSTVPQSACADQHVFIDFAHLKGQLPLARVLDQLGLTARVRGAGAQRRCACPIHRGDGRGRSFSANLDENVFSCFDAQCGAKGDVIDLWAAIHKLDLRRAAEDLVVTFALEPAPATGTEKRHG